MMLMFVSYRQLIALASASIAIVALALAFRIPHSSVPRFDGNGAGVTAVRPPALAPADSFYGTNIRVKAAFAGSAAAPDRSPTTGSVPAVQSAASASPTPTASGGFAAAVTAAAYLVGDVSTGKIYLERNSRLVLPVASMSKLITAIAATDTLSPTATISITQPEADVASDTSRIGAGESFTVSEILYPLLLNSSNVAAEALASSSDRVKFLELMSSYAWEIGMSSTFFADPSGISPKNISTAGDFFALAQYLYKSRPDILAITRTIATSTATTTDHGAHDFVSIHPYVADPAFLGGKTGHTPEAHDTMLTMFNIGGHPIAIIVLASDDRKSDTAMLRASVETTLGALSR